MKVCTWNIGCFSFLKYAKHFGIKFRGQEISHEYFQPKINGSFVSKNLEEINPDLIFLQEFYYPEDVESIQFLKNYPHKKLIDAWYRKHCILIASKIPFKITKNNNFSIVHLEKINFIPMHLNSFSARKRLNDMFFWQNLQKILKIFLFLVIVIFGQWETFFFLKKTDLDINC